MKKHPKTAKLSPPGKGASKPAKVTIHKLPTGVRGLDDILGGGIPEFSFNIIAGTPGCGKTTLAHQIAFANATPKKPALYFTVLGEPAMKMLRYQQQYSFFDESKLGKAIRFINLTDVVLEKDLNAVLEEIIKQVTAANPGIVVVDSFRTVVRKAISDGERSGDAIVHPAPRPVSDQLGSHDVSGRRICRGGDARQSAVHHGRRPLLALAGDGAEFRGAEAADHEAARPGIGAGIAHHPHQRRRAAGLLAHAGT